MQSASDGLPHGLSADESWMREAIGLALQAESAGEVPVGALVVQDGRLVGHGENRVIRDADPTAHAEIVALRAAARRLGNYRLGGCDLYSTLEPCAMCAGALVHARVRRLVYAAADPKAGACGSVLDVVAHPLLNHRVEVCGGMMALECGQMLSTFFLRRRQATRQAPVKF